MTRDDASVAMIQLSQAFANIRDISRVKRAPMQGRDTIYLAV